jgi:hypothetical protein
MPKCNHIVDQENYTGQGIELPRNIINPDLYYNNPNINKKDRTILFLEKQTSIPNSIENKLYPNQSNILMFNNINIKHDQNIGFLSELNRAEILQESSFFVCDSDYYALEAKLCGCEILDINNLDNNITNKYDLDYVHYKEYLGKILL